MDSIYLQGSEDITASAGRMTSAAHNMIAAANQIDTAAASMMRFLDGFADRMQGLVERLETNGIRPSTTEEGSPILRPQEQKS